MSSFASFAFRIRGLLVFVGFGLGGAGGVAAEGAVEFAAFAGPGDVAVDHLFVGESLAVNIGVVVDVLAEGGAL